MAYNNSHEDLRAICGALHRASKYSLQAEVIMGALHYAQKHPTASVEEAMIAGLAEWDVDEWDID